MSATRWLDEAEQHVWRRYLQATQLLQDRLGRDLLAAEGGFAMPEYELLVRLSEHPQWSARMSQLAQGLVHSRSRLTHTAARLEERGLITREACPDDGRGVLAVMTEAGHAALAAAAPAHVASVREHLFDQLDDEDVAALGRVADKIVAHLHER